MEPELMSDALDDFAADEREHPVMTERHEDLANMAQAAKRLAAAEAKVHAVSEALRAHPVGARSGPRGGKTATLTARLRTACEARDRAGAEFERQLVRAGWSMITLDDVK